MFCGSSSFSQRRTSWLSCCGWVDIGVFCSLSFSLTNTNGWNAFLFLNNFTFRVKCLENSSGLFRCRLRSNQSCFLEREKEIWKTNLSYGIVDIIFAMIFFYCANTKKTDWQNTWTTINSNINIYKKNHIYKCMDVVFEEGT